MARFFIALALTALASNAAIAQQRMGPPQEAFDACSGSSAASSCSFEGHRGTINGTCGTIPGDNSKLVCKPSNMQGPGKGGQSGPGKMNGSGQMNGPGQQSGSRAAGGGMNDRRGPPPEALSACEGSSDGNSCSFTGRNGEALSGTCHTHGEQLACAPSGRPPMR